MNQPKHRGLRGPLPREFDPNSQTQCVCWDHKDVICPVHQAAFYPFTHAKHVRPRGARA